MVEIIEFHFNGELNQEAQQELLQYSHRYGNFSHNFE